VASPFNKRPGRDRAAVAALVGLLAVLAGCAPARPRPNVLLITVDTLRADHLGPDTPALAALAEAGVSFTRAQSTSSWTLPSLASLMTSTYTSTHRCWDMKTELDGSFSTLAERFAAAGYATAAVASHVFLAPKHGLHQGFEDYDTTLVKGLVRSHEAISSPAVTARSLAWLDDWSATDDGRPFLLWSHYFDPHEVYHEHPDFASFGADEPGRYKSEVAFTDYWVGELLAGLAARGLDEDTLVVLVADHGEEFGDHGATRHGHTLYDELTRVPLVLRAPTGWSTTPELGGFEPGEIDTPVSVVDVLPTLLELCDVAPLGGGLGDLAGRSLVPAMQGAAVPAPPVLLEVRLRKGRHADAVVLDELKLVRWADGREELYDLVADPGEQQDLASARAADRARLGEVLDLAIRRAAALGGSFGVAPELELTPEELQRLADLGYVDADG
jgi:arylsulfatase A-like enzyme